MQKLFMAIGLLLAVAVASPAQVTTIFTSNPTQFFSNADPVELGVKFRSDVSGLIIGVRFYKGVSDTSVHTGSLWSTTGQLLATGTFNNETGIGWQQLNFSAPVAITANTTYVGSYHTSSSIVATPFGFQTQGVDNPPLHALRDNVNGPNSVYAYSNGAVFPTQTYHSNNYWVDVVFATSRFGDNGDGTITDNLTGLMWEKKMGCTSSNTDIHCVGKAYSWSTNGLDPNGTLFTDFLPRMTLSTSDDGVTLSNSCLAGHCDWRIPNIAELMTIVPQPCTTVPCIDPIFGVAGQFYWSSTTIARDPAVAWGVKLAGMGATGLFSFQKNDTVSARAVRGGR